MIEPSDRHHRTPARHRRSPPALPLFAHAARAGEVRRVAHRRHVRRQLGCALAVVGVALIGFTIAAPPAPRLVWNASASAPPGLYAVTPGARLARGDMAIAWAPPGLRALAATRHYLPRNVPLVKRVRGVSGDRVCAIAAAISVNGAVIAVRRRHDAAGRPLPWWRGCVTLSEDNFLLLNDAPGSFDGRYFGPSRSSDVIGRATPLWVR